MVRINDDWIVDVDPYNYILKRDMHKTALVSKKKGEEKTEEPVYITKGYFSSLQAALNRLSEEMVRERLMDGAKCLNEAVDAIRECRDEWRKLIRLATEVENV